jgi:transposase
MKKIPKFFTGDWYFDKKELGKSDIAIAEELNISIITFRKWKREINVKSGKFRKKTSWDEYKDRAADKDVSYPMFMKRIRAGKTPEQAIEEGRKGNGRYGKEEKDKDMEYDKSNRIKYNPEFHENHRKPFEEDDLIYICNQYGASSCRDIAFAVGKTENSIYKIVTRLKENGKFDYYRSLDY